MAIRICCLLTVILLSATVYAQKERIYLQLDKYACQQGDTVWFKAYILRGRRLTTLSTNLYVEVLTSTGHALSQYNFPAIGGVSTGQVILPDSINNGNYYLRAFTRYQLNNNLSDLFSIPVFVSNRKQPSNLFF